MKHQHPVSLPRVAMLREHGYSTREALDIVQSSYSDGPVRLSGVRLTDKDLQGTAVDDRLRAWLIKYGGRLYPLSYQKRQHLTRSELEARLGRSVASWPDSGPLRTTYTCPGCGRIVDTPERLCWVCEGRAGLGTLTLPPPDRAGAAQILEPLPLPRVSL